MKRQKRFSNLSRWAFFVCLSLLVAIGQAHGTELVSPNTIVLDSNETSTLSNTRTPLDNLKAYLNQLKEEFKESTEDSEKLLNLLEEAWTEIDGLNSFLAQSMERSSDLQNISENLKNALEAQDKAHRAGILRLEIERGWWIAGTVVSSILAAGLGIAWLLK